MMSARVIRSSMFKRSLATTSTWTWPKSQSPETPVFIVSPSTGFLPRQDPIADLPKKYEALNSLLDRMSLTLPDGTPGLLSKGAFGNAVDKELPLYDMSEVNDQELLMALFRDYTFVASSYLLEPCDIMNRKKGEYGLGRDRLPKQVAVPLTKIAEKIKAKPFMEYAQSYALYNYKRKDKSKGLDYDNLELVRKFSGMESEHGFILVHVAMVRHTPALVDATLRVLQAVESKDRPAFNEAMTDAISVMNTINGVMETMWGRSLPEDYMKFRTFIMGTKGQTEMFPNGVIYEGVDTEPKYYRGESGANDSIVPTCDNLLELTQKMPTNPMTEILQDFRSYRPKNHTEWLSFVEDKATSVGVDTFASEEAESLKLFVLLLDQVRDFRHRHWMFAKEYIIKRTAYPKATGGSPMATWLPNQLSVVLNAIDLKSHMLMTNFGNTRTIKWKTIGEIRDRAAAQKRVLDKDVASFKSKFKE